MPRIKIDQREVEVPPGATILEAAGRLGIDVPTLCFLKGFGASTSCLVCMVKVRDTNRLVPACATAAVDGMEIESETDEIHQVRRTALELLLSDHVGDCLAPCHFACPAHMDIPNMLRQIQAEDFRGALVTVKHDIALPAVLGRVCPKPCEKACRRSKADGPIAVCDLKRYVADLDLASDDPYLPECGPSTGKRVAVVGAGPSGLAAAYFLVRKGHAVTLFDDSDEPGGRLRDQMGEGPEKVPRHVLDGEIDRVLRLGVELRPNRPVGEEASFDALRREFDAVLVACGTSGKGRAEEWGLSFNSRGIEVKKGTYETNLPGVFAAGGAIRAKGMVVRSVADGKEAAASIDNFLSGKPAGRIEKPFSVRMGRLADDEMAELAVNSPETPRGNPADPVAGFESAAAVAQAGRCFHCDCRKLDTCRLKRYAILYRADPNRYRGERAVFRQCTQHSLVIHEPGKCIDCGLCIEIAARAEEPLGLTFVGRGFEVRVGVPFGRPLEEALRKVAAECVSACPTAALAMKEDRPGSELPILGQR